MPMFEYKCSSCGHEFEELIQSKDKNKEQFCKLCGKGSKRKEIYLVSSSTTIDPRRDTVYSPKEIDKVIGADTDKKWKGYDERWKKRYEDRQQKRWKGQQPAPVNLPRDADGKFTPIMHLGDKKEREVRKEFSTALQEHRAERKSKGLGQFDGPGAIAEKK